MINNSLQGDLQEAIRNALNCANSYEGDLYALCNLYGVDDGAVSGRLISVAQKHSPTIGTASGALNYLLQNPTVLPSMGLNFVDGTDRLDSRVTFTRSSNAWRFNSAGVLTQATTNTPRFDYNPSTLAPRGLLIEEQRTNLNLYSADTTNAAWVKVRSSVPGTAVQAPDGTNTFYKIVEDSTASNSHFIRQDVAVTTGQRYTKSVYLRAGERTQFIIRFNSDGGCFADEAAIFTLTGNGTAAVYLNAPAAYGIEKVGTNVYRCWASANCIATGTHVSRWFLANGGTDIYTGDGTSGLYMWGAQIEAGAFATSYIPTTTAAATRAADVAQMLGTNFSSWYNATEGTLFAESLITRQAATALTGITSILDNTAANAIQVFYRVSGISGAQVTTASVNVLDANNGVVIAANAAAKIAVGYKQNDFAASTNATSAITWTSGSVPSGVNKMQIGLSAPGVYLNGYIRRIAYYPRRLSNSELQAITS